MGVVFVKCLLFIHCLRLKFLTGRELYSFMDTIITYKVLWYILQFFLKVHIPCFSNTASDLVVYSAFLGKSFFSLSYL